MGLLCAVGGVGAGERRSDPSPRFPRTITPDGGRVRARARLPAHQFPPAGHPRIRWAGRLLRARSHWERLRSVGEGGAQEHSKAAAEFEEIAREKRDLEEIAAVVTSPAPLPTHPK